MRLARVDSGVKLRGDASVMTYTGHAVKNTLIRCRFSPLATTGQVIFQIIYFIVSIKYIALYIYWLWKWVCRE